MSRARHERVRSRSTAIVITAIVFVLVGGGAFAAVRLTRSGGGAAAPPPATITPPATTAPTTPTTQPSPTPADHSPTASPTGGPSASPTTAPSASPSDPVTSPSGPPASPSTGPNGSPSPDPSPSVTTLRPGMSGPEVLHLQQQLQSLGYWLGHADSSYGDATTQAVMAFQGYEGLARDGIAGPITQTALLTAKHVVPKDPSTDEIEIDKAHQIAIVVRDGEAKYVFHTSTGFDGSFVDPEGNTQVAHTPDGHFTFLWQVDGWRDGHLGMLYRPKYFVPTGVALHGYSNVPGSPASHGCARVSFEAINFIWDQNLAPLQSKVYVYG